MGVSAFCLPHYKTQVSDREYLNACDVYIWQKSVNFPVMNELPGRHYWDVCDPAWWWQPQECHEIASRMTGIVASSPALRRDFATWLGMSDKSYVIPDALKPSHFHSQRQHEAASPVRLIWFGIAANRIALLSVMANLERLTADGYEIELTIMDDRPDVPLNYSQAFPVHHVQWQLDKEVEILAAHDIAVLPPYPGAWGRVKSDNKAQTAAACGLPVLSDVPYCQALPLMRASDRQEAADMLRASVRDVAQSAWLWETILCS